MLPALLQTGLTVLCTHTFMEHSEETPKQSLHSPISTRGLLVVLLPRIVVLCFPRVPLPGKIRALISHPWGTAGEEVTVQGRGAHPARGLGVAGMEPSYPGEPSQSHGVRDACPARGTQGALCT